VQEQVRSTPVADDLARYAVALVRATRPASDGGDASIASLLRWGAGPRAGQALLLAAKARAVLQGRPFVAVEDITTVAHPCLRHRLQPGYEAEAQGLGADTIIDRLLKTVQLPAAAFEADRAVRAALA
jgi:MoxR-like ATPase